VGKFANALKKWQDEGGEPRRDRAPRLSAKPGQGAAPQGVSSGAGRLTLRELSRRASPGGHLLIDNGTAPAIVEQYKMLRTHLLQYRSGRPPRTILVTSTLRGEGKSSVAANLAISIARSVKEHVLLMDCDLREPSLHRLFGLHPARGLVDHLRRGVGLAELLLHTEVDKLSFLPAGAKAADAAELLASEKMRSLLAEVRARYDDRFIVLDSTPLLPTTDPSILARQVDAVLLVVRAGMANRELIARMVETVGREKFLGVVFNAVEPGPTSYAYKYYSSAYRYRRE
jgi:protein-tyrosine kinase